MIEGPRIIGIGEELPPMEPPRGRGLTTGTATTGEQKKAKAKTGERFATLNAFVDFSLASLSGSEAAVWLILYRDTKNGTARTSFDDLARRAGCNRRNVTRAMKRLEAKGLVKVAYRGGFRRGMSVYCVHPLASSP